MKRIVYLLSGLFLALLLQSCTEKSVTNVAEYGKFLAPGIPNQNLLLVEKDRQFWQSRIDNNPGDIVSISKLAGIMARRFSYSGNISDLHASDSLYNIVHSFNRNTSSGTFRALAANCITQHRFKQAVAMELGNYPRAKQSLKNLANKNSFDYLIRESKYNDQVNGDLEKAIELMEKAYATLPANPSPSLFVWIKSNLGDMYGHANRFRESYISYLEALAKDPHDYHALKGIAWLAFSHDKDVVNAKKIINYLKQQHPIPDYELLLAEFAAYEKDSVAQKKHQQTFLAAIQNDMYGDMYNKYLFNLLAEDLNDADRAFVLARREVKNRPSPEVFGWLAWAYFKKGDMSNAVQTSGWYVENKCHEPEILYYIGRIYHADGNEIMARKYLQEASQSSYELGPATGAQIEEILENL
jgi:tetratricopeptide (TPR) repeat protein